MGEGTKFTQSNDFSATQQAVAGTYGPRNLTPYVLIGKPEFGDPDNQSSTYRKNLGRDDSVQPGQLKAGYQNNNGGNTFLKRAAIFVQPLKLYKESSVFQNAPASYDPTVEEGVDEDWAKDARALDNANKIYTKGTLSLDLDTLRLYEGQGAISSLSTLAGEQVYDPMYNPSPVRGIPVRFQKIYFYGSPALGPYTEGWEGPPDGDYQTKGRSDGRGSLFSAQVLIADPINVAKEYDYDAGLDQISGFQNPEGSDLEPPDQFKFLKDKGYWNYTGNTWSTAKERYHMGKGMSSSWQYNSFSQEDGEPTLVIGDGAIGYNDFNLQSLISLNTTLNSNYALALEFFRTEVVMCIPSTESGVDPVSITGFVPFQPHPKQQSEFYDLVGQASGVLPLIYDIRSPVLNPSATGSDGFSIVTTTPAETENTGQALFLDNVPKYNMQGGTWDKATWGTARGRIMEDLDIRPRQWSGAATFLGGDVLVRPPKSGVQPEEG